MPATPHGQAASPTFELYEDRMIASALERGDTAAAGFWRRVKDDVDKAPPLTPEQISTIRVLLAPELRAARTKVPQA